MRQFRFGVSHPRNVIRPRFCGEAEQDGADHNARVIARHMGKMQPTRRITNRIDPPITHRPQIGTYRHPLASMLHTCRVQIQLREVHFPPHGNQQMASSDRSLARFHGDLAISAARHRLRAGVFMQRDSLPPQVLHHDLGHVGIITAQRLRPFNHRHFAAQLAMRLRHFHANRPPSDNDQVVGLFCEIKDRLIGQVRHILQSVD